MAISFSTFQFYINIQALSLKKINKMNNKFLFSKNILINLEVLI